MATKKKAPNERKRKIGERTEVVERKLTQVEIEDSRARVIDILQESDELDAKLDEIKASYKSLFASLDSRKSHELGLIRSGRAREEIVVEEWLTDQNEVVRVNKATGLEIGNRRTASASELQEELPLDRKPDEDDGEVELDREEAADSAPDEFGEADS